MFYDKFELTLDDVQVMIFDKSKSLTLCLSYLLRYNFSSVS